MTKLEQYKQEMKLLKKKMLIEKLKEEVDLMSVELKPKRKSKETKDDFNNI